MLKVLAGVDQAQQRGRDGERRAARHAAHRRRLRAPGRHRAPPAGRARGAGLRRRAAPAQGRQARARSTRRSTGVLDELSLDEHAATRVGMLSGGQRRRTSVAVELLGQAGAAVPRRAHHRDGPGPGDEDDGAVPQAGGRLARRGAGDPRDEEPGAVRPGDRDGAGRAARVRRPAGRRAWRSSRSTPTTRSTRSSTSRRRSAGRPRTRPPDGEPGGGRGGERPGSGAGSTIAQTRVLVGRYLKLLVRDRKNMVLLIGQAPILALAGVGLFNAGILDRPGGSPFLSIQFLFLAGLTVLWLGAIDAAQEIVKERAVLERERAIGVKLRAYVASKLIVLFGLVDAPDAALRRAAAGLPPARRRPRDAWLSVFALLHRDRLRGRVHGAGDLRLLGHPRPGHELRAAGGDPAAAVRGRDRAGGEHGRARPDDLLRDLLAVVAGRRWAPRWT